MLLKTAFLYLFKKLTTIFLHIQNLQHMTAVINTYIPQKTFLGLRSKITVAATIAVPRAVASRKIK